MVKFFDPETEKAIIKAIRNAELKTSGEIRIHLQKDAVWEVLREAQMRFYDLNMHKTKDRNGVLIFLVPPLRKFAIVGDEGIDAVVPEHFWEEVRDVLAEYFRRQAFGDGIIKAVEIIGEKLSAYFPYQKDDENELSDDISYGD